MYSGITSGRVLDRELLYTKILEVNLFAFGIMTVKVSIRHYRTCYVIFEYMYYQTHSNISDVRV